MVLKREDNGVAVLTMDAPDSPVNTITREFAEELAETSTLLRANPPRALVIASAKKGNWHAGADINAFQENLKDMSLAADALKQLQELFDNIRTLPFPVVAAINGTALGGGLELALTCHGRVTTTDRKVKLGLPEVQLGVLPAAGGTQYLPRLVGIQNALDLILTGRQITARKAKKIGLVDEVVAPPVLVSAATKLALSLAETLGETDGNAFSKIGNDVLDFFRNADAKEIALEDNPLGRKVLFDQARKKLLEKTRGNYPAPELALNAIQIGATKGIEAGLEAEARFFIELVSGDVAQELIRIFFTTTKMKKDTGVDDASVKPREVRKVGMLGAGLMGSGIANVTASRARIPVRLKDRDYKGLGRGMAMIRKGLDSGVRRKKITKRKRDEILALVRPTIDFTGFSNTDVVIEAIFEDIEVKKEALAEIEKLTDANTIFASNTSTIPITDIAKSSKRPENVVGMHYFSPVEKMPLLEIIETEKTAPWVTATCVELGKKQGKTVIVVGDGPGFYTSRILGPYMSEAAHILAEGVSVEDIDSALLDFGFPVGPIKLLDEVGIDVAHKASKRIKGNDSEATEGGGLEKLIADGRLGRKSKKGFYLYEGKKKGVDQTVYEVLGVRPNSAMTAEEIAERCVLQMVNESFKCKAEGILRSEEDGDIGAIFGLGFPPFRGGPFRYADSVGRERLKAKMERYSQSLGDRFTPAF